MNFYGKEITFMKYENTGVLSGWTNQVIYYKVKLSVYSAVSSLYDC